MSLLEKFDAMRSVRADLAARGMRPFGARTEQLLSPTEAVVEGRRVILAGTNNYLGLTFDPECIAAAQRAVAEQGTGTTGSRMANGTYAAHGALERELAQFYGKRLARRHDDGARRARRGHFLVKRQLLAAPADDIPRDNPLGAGDL